jgi:tetratricopeptide (TPR) repeat protein
LANTLNVKQKMLLSRADAIAHSLSSGITAHFFSPQISPEITWVLGNEHQSFGEYRQATDFFKLAMQSGDSDTAQVFAPRAQAMLDMLPATGVQSIKEGEDLFQEAINHIKGTDDISIEIKGDTYYDWGTSEYNANNPSGGLNKLDMAEKAYSSLHIANPDRANRLQGVELQRTTLFGLSDTGISIAKTLVGTWAITGSMSSGQLVISNEANSGQFIGNLSKHPSTWGPEAALVFNEVGTIAVQDASHASFNWKLQNGLLGMKAQGTSVLTINSGEGLIVVAEPSDAPAPTKYTLKRVQH